MASKEYKSTGLAPEHCEYHSDTAKQLHPSPCGGMESSSLLKSRGPHWRIKGFSVPSATSSPKMLSLLQDRMTPWKAGMGGGSQEDNDVFPAHLEFSSSIRKLCQWSSSCISAPKLFFSRTECLQKHFAYAKLCIRHLQTSNVLGFRPTVWLLWVHTDHGLPGLWVPVNTRPWLHTQPVFGIWRQETSLLKPLGDNTHVHTQFGCEDFTENRKSNQGKLFQQTFLIIAYMAGEDKKGAWKADCSYQGGRNSLKRFQLWKFYCKNFVISIFLVHFMVLHISVNSYLFSPMPQATGLEHSPAPTLVITEGRECISCHSRAEHCHFQPHKTLQVLLAHQANVNLRGIFFQHCCHFFPHHHCCLICLRNLSWGTGQ